ncbi:MAG: response regulator [Balneolaceae bacterium]
MRNAALNIILADDDRDDVFLFKNAIEELALSIRLATVYDGDKLMKRLLQKTLDLPDAIFLDLNMPLKSGHECLDEIKESEELSHLPVIIFSTSYQQKVVDELYEKGAHYYIQKPSSFGTLQSVIKKALFLITETTNIQPSKDDFVLTV